MPHAPSHRASRNRPFRLGAVALALLVAAAGDAAADCTCRAKGRDYKHGERICLSGPAGPRSAVCGMDQNVASWIFIDEPCAVSALPAAQRLAAGALRPR